MSLRHLYDEDIRRLWDVVKMSSNFLPTGSCSMCSDSKVSLLIVNLADEFSNESFCTVIFDEFFLTGLGRDNVIRHLLKLLWYIYPKLPPARLHSLIKALQPTGQHNEAVHSLYDALHKKISNSSTESQVMVPCQIDSLGIDCPGSPLPGISTPRPGFS